MDSHPDPVEDSLAEDILVGVHSLVVGSPGAEGSLDVAVGSQGSHDRMEGPRVLLDDQACTCGVGPSAGQGNPGDPALLPSNYSCLDRCLRLHRLPVVEALRLLLPPWKRFCWKGRRCSFVLPGLGDGWGHGSR